MFPESPGTEEDEYCAEGIYYTTFYCESSDVRETWVQFNIHPPAFFSQEYVRGHDLFSPRPKPIVLLEDWPWGQELHNVRAILFF